jgi:hypothetical protein
MEMATIESKFEASRTFNSFFGPVHFVPGLNSDIPGRLWKNLKTHNADVQSFLKEGLLVEVNEI